MTRRRAVLVVMSGRPATGKSTIAQALAQQTRTPYLRVDRIEQAIVAGSEHRQRVEGRPSDVVGLTKPTWA